MWKNYVYLWQAAGNKVPMLPVLCLFNNKSVLSGLTKQSSSEKGQVQGLHLKWMKKQPMSAKEKLQKTFGELEELLH